MERLIIDGGKRLGGELTVQGSKNSALPIIAATLAVSGTSVIHNCPELSDVLAELNILRVLGCKASFLGSTVTVDSACADACEIPAALMKEMRSSIIFLGALLSRFGKASVSVPGGCNIGSRPIDYHLSLFREMGVKTQADEHGNLLCECPDGLHGAHINLPYPSVGATENAILAAVGARGKTVIENAAREPEIVDLASFLNRCGASIYGAGESTVIIGEAEKLHACEYTVIPDRIVAATYMAAVAVTGGRALLKGVEEAHLEPVLAFFKSSGCSTHFIKDSLRIHAPARLSGMGVIRTGPYPGFPTDCQPVFMAMAAAANGVTVVTERIFENRFRHAEALRRLGAHIEIENNAVAIIEGAAPLFGAEMTATDLRGGTALAVGALAAHGRSIITGLHHIDRGCERIESCLAALGAQIKREN